MRLAQPETDVHAPSVLRSWLGTAAVPEPATNATSTTLTTVGGAAWVAIGTVVIAVAALSIVVGPAPPNEAAYLQSPADHATAATLAFSPLFAAADLLLVPALVALCPALGPAGKAAALIGTGIPALWAVQDLVVTGTTSLALVSLARDDAGAGVDARRGALLAARYPLAVLPTAAFLSYVVSAAGLVLIGAVMLRSPFPRGTGLLAPSPRPPWSPVDATTAVAALPSPPPSPRASPTPDRSCSTPATATGSPTRGPGPSSSASSAPPSARRNPAATTQRTRGCSRPTPARRVPLPPTVHCTNPGTRGWQAVCRIVPSSGNAR